MTIGVLTFHRCINYGSYWQAACLVGGLRELGHDAVLLDYESAATRAEWRCALSPRLPEPSSAIDRGLYRAKVRKFQQAVAALPMCEPFDLCEPQTGELCDIAVIGSDEVWNLRHPWYGGVPAFFGEGLQARRLVAYAASFGNYDAKEGLDQAWNEKLGHFASISVRDANSHALLQNATGRSVEIVLDPCLQFPPRSGRGSAIYSDCVAVYGHGFPSWLSAALRRWADRHGCTLLSVGYRNHWADRHYIDASPGDFAEIMAGARAVATNFFHGCVFSLLNQKPFICVPSPYRFNKVRDLAALLSLGRHILGESPDQAVLDALLCEPMQEDVGRRIAALRASSFDYLDRTLH